MFQGPRGNAGRNLAFIESRMTPWNPIKKMRILQFPQKVPHTDSCIY